MKPEYFEDLINLCTDISTQENKLLPLCAAENIVSPFSKIPLDTFLQEKYIMGGVLNIKSIVTLWEAKSYMKYMSCYLANAINYMDANMQTHELYLG